MALYRNASGLEVELTEAEVELVNGAITRGELVLVEAPKTAGK